MREQHFEGEGGDFHPQTKGQNKQPKKERGKLARKFLAGALAIGSIGHEAAAQAQLGQHQKAESGKRVEAKKEFQPGILGMDKLLDRVRKIR